MSESPNLETIHICDAVLGYLHKHPEAADSPEGIATWWLEGLTPSLSVEAILKALDRLVSEKQIVRIYLADGRTLYQSADKVSGSHPAWLPDQRKN